MGRVFEKIYTSVLSIRTPVKNAGFVFLAAQLFLMTFLVGDKTRDLWLHYGHGGPTPGGGGILSIFSS